jgi:hypothetical protein
MGSVGDGSSNPRIPINPTRQSITKGHFPFPEMGLVCFTSSKSELVTMMDSFVFDKRKKQIVRKT